MKTFKIAWCCVRHEMTTAQLALARKELHIGKDDILEVVHDVNPWSETESASEDANANCMHWANLFSDGYDAVFGIFPMSSFYSLFYGGINRNGTMVFVPISKKCVSYIGNKIRNTTMQFVRWQMI